MKIAVYARVTLMAIALCNAAGARAAVLAFNGSATATAMVGSDPTCAPLPFRAIVTDGPGTSSLGSFTYSHNACTLGATGPVNGSFVLNFGGSLLTALLKASRSRGLASQDCLISCLHIPLAAGAECSKVPQALSRTLELLTSAAVRPLAWHLISTALSMPLRCPSLRPGR